MAYDVDYVRRQFPALSLEVSGYPAVYLDGPGGTQVPQRVIDAVVNYLVRCNANAGGPFHTSRESDRILKESRLAVADFLGAEADEVSFGQNTTTLMFQLALALGRDKQKERNEILITELDHEANRGPWEALAQWGFTIREVRLDPAGCTIDMDDFQAKLSERTAVAAFGYASNGVGTVSDVKQMVNLAHSVGALTVVDAVHYALHGPIDVKALDTDFLLCSAYKFFGPHLGIFYGKKEVFQTLQTYRLKVQSEAIPYRMETGTLNHEGIAGAREAVEFIADLGRRFGRVRDDAAGSERRKAIVLGMESMEEYEQPLARRLIEGLSEMKKVKVHGPSAGSPRTSTVSFTVDRMHSERVAELLGEKGFFVWAGHFYAIRLVERLGLQDQGGLVRIGLSPYNTAGEIERLLDEVGRMAR
ncbi:MAG: cysteine desulfurase-like protein [Bacillota bacterium]